MTRENSLSPPSSGHAPTSADFERSLAGLAPKRLEGGDRPAAVALILRDASHGAEILLIQRAQRDGDPWSGHISFPGGRWSQEDSDLEATACRETLEEVGLDLSACARRLGALDDLPAIGNAQRQGFFVRPLVFALEAPVEPHTSDEASALLWAPLSELASGARRTIHRWHRPDGRSLDLPAFGVGGHVVWGMTFRMLEALLRTLQSPPSPWAGP